MLLARDAGHDEQAVRRGEIEQAARRSRVRRDGVDARGRHPDEIGVLGKGVSRRDPELRSATASTRSRWSLTTHPRPGGDRLR